MSQDYITSSQNSVLMTEVAKAASPTDILLEYVTWGEGVQVTLYTDTPLAIQEVETLR